MEDALEMGRAIAEHGPSAAALAHYGAIRSGSSCHIVLSLNGPGYRESDDNIIHLSPRKQVTMLSGPVAQVQKGVCVSLRSPTSLQPHSG